MPKVSWCAEQSWDQTILSPEWLGAESPFRLVNLKPLSMELSSLSRLELANLGRNTLYIVILRALINTHIETITTLCATDIFRFFY